MIKLNKEHMEVIEAHGCEGYPHEVCGIIMGHFDEGTHVATEVRRAANLNNERAHDRYEMDPKDLLKAEREGRERGVEIIGYYHSHPDHPDRPSEFDRQRAWPGYSYLIASVMGGKEVTARSWLLNEETSTFDEEEIEILS
ncbi:MAG: M67 family metallopeptidase [Deltaproteobacteria bacterium]|nr:M67 family metallopeptidase [Deltaproteobacteria bacterium]